MKSFGIFEPICLKYKNAIATSSNLQEQLTDVGKQRLIT